MGLTSAQQVEGIMRTHHKRTHPMAMTHKFGILFIALRRLALSRPLRVFGNFPLTLRLHLFETHKKVSLLAQGQQSSVMLDRRLLKRPAHDFKVDEIVIQAK